VDDPVKRATWSAVAAVIAYADVPIVYFLREVVELAAPGAVRRGRPSRAPFHWPLRINAFGMLFLMSGLISLRARPGALRREEETAPPLRARRGPLGEARSLLMAGPAGVISGGWEFVWRPTASPRLY